MVKIICKSGQQRIGSSLQKPEVVRVVMASKPSPFVGGSALGRPSCWSARRRTWGMLQPKGSAHIGTDGASRRPFCTVNLSKIQRLHSLDGDRVSRWSPQRPPVNRRAVSWLAHQSFSVPMRSPCALLEHSVHEWCRAEEWRPCPPPSETGRRWPRWPLDHATSRSSSFV